MRNCVFMSRIFNYIVVMCSFLFYSGFHHAIIHNNFDMLTRLLDLVAKYPHLKSSLNDQNALFQVIDLLI